MIPYVMIILKKMVGWLKMVQRKCWRSGWFNTCEKLEKILDPATEYDRNQWDINLVKDDATKPIYDNF